MSRLLTILCGLAAFVSLAAAGLFGLSALFDPGAGAWSGVIIALLFTLVFASLSQIMDVQRQLLAHTALTAKAVKRRTAKR